MKMKSMLIVITVIMATISCKMDKKNDSKSALEDGIYAEFTTNYGDFTAQLYYKKAPMTVANFVSLAEGTNPKVSSKFKGKPYFDGLTFHRIIDGFMIQGGDPDGNGTGGPGYEFPNETDTGLKHDDKGILSMANAGPDTNGSQFFITLAPQPRLDGGYSVFGKIVQGQEVVDSIGKVQVEPQTNKPTSDVIIKTVKIQKIGDDANNFDAAKVFNAKLEDFEHQKEAEKEKLEKQIDSLAEGFTKTKSGLRYKITKEVKNGKKPKSGQTVSVYYEGMLPNGDTFDKRLEEDGQEPIKFEVGTGRVIPGWDEGLQLLKEGEEARFIIPPELAYGERGAGPIPPNSVLIFDVKLAKIGK